jgi:peptide/nickel transport system ATP-binding protein
MLFISHDLAVIKRVSDRVAVMYLGAVCELAPAQLLFSRPAHPYTAALLSAIPQPLPGNRRSTDITAAYDFPLSTGPPSGCRFHPRCPRMKVLCTGQSPPMSEIAIGHHVACHFPLIENLSQ